MNRLGLIFPGQGSQFVGMGRGLYERYETFRRIFAGAERILQINILDLCLTGPRAALDATVNTQLAVLTFEIALYETLRESGLTAPDMTAGHSLGEYSALYASGMLELEDVLKLVLARAKRHEKGVPPGTGAMAAIVGLDVECVDRLCRENTGPEQTVDTANLNAPNQIVVSGHKEAVERVMLRAKELGARMIVPLPISVPCHCRLLREASERYAKDLEKTSFKPPQVPVVPNCAPDIFYTEHNAAELLARQIVSPVRWQATVERMIASGVDVFLEIGPKKVLSGLVKSIDRRARLFYSGDVDSMQKALDVLQKPYSGFPCTPPSNTDFTDSPRVP